MKHKLLLKGTLETRVKLECRVWKNVKLKYWKFFTNHNCARLGRILVVYASHVQVDVTEETTQRMHCFVGCFISIGQQHKGPMITQGRGIRRLPL